MSESEAHTKPLEKISQIRALLPISHQKQFKEDRKKVAEIEAYLLKGEEIKSAGKIQIIYL